MSTQPKQGAANQSEGVQNRFIEDLRRNIPILVVIVFPLIIWWFAVFVRIEGKAEEAFYFSIDRNDLLTHHDVDEPLLFLVWCSVYFVTIVVNSVSLIYSLYIICKSSERFIVFLIFFAIGIFLTFLFYHCNRIAIYATHLLVPKNFTSCPREHGEREIFYMLHAQWCIIRYSYSEDFYRRLFLGLRIFNFFSVHNCCFFLIAASSTLTSPPKCQIWSAKLLFYRAASARNLLFIGSLFLTIEIIFEFTLNIWLGSLIKEGDILGNYRSHAVGIIIYHGFWYTLTLLSIFVTLNRFFMQRSCKLARIINPYGTQKSWVEWVHGQGFIIFGRGSMYRLVGALLPVLTSVMSTVAQAIIKGVT